MVGDHRRILVIPDSTQRDLLGEKGTFKMPIMAKRKKVDQHPLRFDNADLLAAITRYASEKRQSRNAAILTILEEVMRQRGYLAPAVEPEKEKTEE